MRGIFKKKLLQLIQGREKSLEFNFGNTLPNTDTGIVSCTRISVASSGFGKRVLISKDSLEASGINLRFKLALLINAELDCSASPLGSYRALNLATCLCSRIRWTSQRFLHFSSFSGF